METTFRFYDKDIKVVLVDDKYYAAVRHICDGVGIDNPTNQLKKLANNPDVFMCRVMATHDTSGRVQEMVGIPLERINLWLGGISPAKVKPEIRAELIKYQCECADVLFEHFMRKPATSDLDGIVAQMVAEFKSFRVEIREELKSFKAAAIFTFGDDTPTIMRLISEIADLEGIDGREVWGDIQVALDVQSYKKMGRKILNYLKNRKDGSGLSLAKQE